MERLAYNRIFNAAGNVLLYPGLMENVQLQGENERGFTLIEVLLALAIVAIALTALLKANAENINNMARLKEKSISHWVANQAIESIQLNLIPIHLNQETHQVTSMLGQKWYWRARIQSTTLKNVQKIVITLSKNKSGPFQDPVYGFRYKS